MGIGSKIKDAKRIFSQDGSFEAVNSRISNLETHEYKITYYEVVSGTSGTLTVPSQGTINADEFGLSGNAILSKIDVNGKPTFESPVTSGGSPVTASLNVLTGAWVASGTYTDTNVALIYSIKINALYYDNLVYNNIIETVKVTADVGTTTLQSVTDAGNTTTNTIETAGYVKTGGTSSQFLKADGTVDSSVYITSSALTPYLTTASAALTYFPIPTGTTSQYLRGDGTLATFPTIPSGTVTSVDLTMPSAFTVSGNPVTNSGTLAVTGAGVVSQYIRGDGTLANFPTSTGGGSSVSYYLNGSVAQGTIGGIAFKEVNKTPVIGAGTDFTINANGYIQSFITDANDPNQLTIPAGNWNFETYFSASSGGGSPSFYVELYKWDGTTLTLIASNSATPEYITNGTVIDLYITALAVPQTTLTLTDRLAIRIYVTHSSKTITLHTEDNHLCQIITTFSTGLTALNGLTAQVQSFGNDTNVTMVSSGSTHTLTWAGTLADSRIASASTWNAKQDALSGTGFVKSTAGVISYDTNTYLTTTSAASTYVPYTGATANVDLGTNTLRVGSGVLATPSLQIGAATVGLYSSSANRMDFVTNGINRMSINADGTVVMGNATTRIVGNYYFDFGTNATGMLLTGTKIELYVGSGSPGTSVNYFTVLGLVSTGASTTFNLTKANNTNQTASTSIAGFNYNGGTRQWATGAITTQSENVWGATTYSFVGASTITNAYGNVFNAPIAGTNCTITNNWAAQFNGKVQINGNLTNNGAIDAQYFLTVTNPNLVATAAARIQVTNGAGNASVFSIGSNGDAVDPSMLYLGGSNKGILFTSNSVGVLKVFDATRNVTIQNGGTFTDNGYRLDVQGTANVLTSLNVGNYATPSAQRIFTIGQDTAWMTIGSCTDLTSQMGIFFGSINFNYSNATLRGNNSGTALNTPQTNGTVWLKTGGIDRFVVLGTNVGQNAFVLTAPNNTNQTASTSMAGWLYNSFTRQWATGNIGVQSENVWGATTYSFVGASTITNAYGNVFNAPIAGTNATITNNWAAQFNGNVQVVGNLEPSASFSYGLGSSTKIWNTFFVNNMAMYNLAAIDATNGLQFRTTTNSTQMKMFNTGNFKLQNAGTFVDNGFRFDVNGTGRFQDTLTVTNKLIAGFNTTPLTGTISDGVTSILGNLQNFTTNYYSGEVLYSEVSGEGLNFGQLCYRNAAGKWQKATGSSAAIAAYNMLGICLQTVGATDTAISILTRGYVESTYLSAGAVGNPLFMSAATAGSITNTAPSTSGNIVRIIGNVFWSSALQTNAKWIVYFNPDNTWIEL